MTDRERFCCVVSSGPVLKSDAIVVLSGDGGARLDFGLGLLAGGAADVAVLSGGLNAPPFSLSACEMGRRAIDQGCSPSQLVLETESANTREQAANVVGIATQRGWTRLLLVTSPYHSYRAYLTFLQALRDASAEDKVHVLNAPVFPMLWFDDANRIGLLDSEFAKIVEYGARGHCATWTEGLEYLKAWESR